MRLIPLDHPIPEGIERPRFRLRLITVNDVVRDYDAVMSSAASLRERFPYWGWPEDDMTLEEDLIDLGWHQKEAQLRRSFNYAVMSPDEARLLGCVYVDPPEKQGADAEVAFWVRDSERGTGLEEEVEAAVRDWLEREWPFEQVRWPGIEMPWAEWDALPDA
jgi:RimJ/RimL family protein N-acetyltransferase